MAGSGNPTRADIVVYNSASAAAKGNQEQIKFIVECNGPVVESGYNQLVSYVFNTSGRWGRLDQRRRRSTLPSQNVWICR